MNLQYNRKLKPFSQDLRNNQTKAEQELWKYLKKDKQGVRFNPSTNT